MDKILITGIGGFIGQYLVEALKDTYEIHGMYEHEESKKKNDLPDTQQHVVNLKDKDGLEKLIKEVQPHFVLHLAAKTEVALSFDNYSEVSEVNYVGTVNLAEANRKFNKNLKLFVMASTMETYGHQDPKNGAFIEDTVQKPMAPYAVAKIASEYYLRYMEYAYKFPFTIFRQTNAYGRTDNDFFVIERIITQMLDGGFCNLGEAAPVRNFIWIDDLVDLYKTTLQKYDDARGQVFCTGPDNPVTIEELADIIAEKTDFKGNINWDTIPRRPGEIYYLNSTPAKAKKILGWEPKIGLSEGLDRTITIWRNK
jgi:nucleoside-diphosphate-sugar epimerase